MAAPQGLASAVPLTKISEHSVDFVSVVSLSFTRHEYQLPHSTQKAFCSPVHRLPLLSLSQASVQFLPRGICSAQIMQCLAKDAKRLSDRSLLTSHRSRPSWHASLCKCGGRV